MDRNVLSKIIAARGEPKFREKQVKQAVYKQLVLTWDQATSLSKEFRAAIAAIPVLTVTPARVAASKKDGTVKALFDLADGLQIETVMISRGRFRTVCVSCQVGCAMCCSFCATGALGLKRNLTADEMIDQVVFFERELKKKKERVTNVVFMGMGEPCANLDNVFEAIYGLNSPDGLALGARKISISTCGIVPGILRIANFPLQINLAVSLHAPTDDLRSEIMPVNKAYSIGQVLEACRGYIHKTNRKLFIEYILLKGVNDHVEQAGELAAIIKDMRPLVQVNLIPFHEAGSSYKTSEPKAVRAFADVLIEEGIPCTTRINAGEDIAAACGQLAGDSVEE